MTYDYIAYIDEAGDDGLKAVKPIDARGSSEWLILSAVVIAAKREGEVAQWIATMTDSAQLRQRQLLALHFSKLFPANRRLVCSSLATLPVRCFVVASNKKNMRGYQNPFAAKIPSKNWFYCWMTRILLERVTHYVRHRAVRDSCDSPKLKIEYSARGGLSYSQMTAYYEWLRMKSRADNLLLRFGNLAWELMDRKLLSVHHHSQRPGLQLADVVASAFFKACDVHDTKAVDPEYAKLLGPRMARATIDGLPVIAGYGVKLLPSLKKANLAEVQKEIFRFYGYPDEWWDPDPSDPRAIRLATIVGRPSSRTPRG